MLRGIYWSRIVHWVFFFSLAYLLSTNSHPETSFRLFVALHYTSTWLVIIRVNCIKPILLFSRALDLYDTGSSRWHQIPLHPLRKKLAIQPVLPVLGAQGGGIGFDMGLDTTSSAGRDTSPKKTISIPIVGFLDVFECFVWIGSEYLVVCIANG